MSLEFVRSNGFASEVWSTSAPFRYDKEQLVEQLHNAAREADERRQTEAHDSSTVYAALNASIDKVDWRPQATSIDKVDWRPQGTSIDKADWRPGHRGGLEVAWGTQRV